MGNTIGAVAPPHGPSSVTEVIPKLAKCMTSKTRGYCFTLNNYTDDEEQQLQQLGRQVQYLVYGRERGGEANTPHLQGYIHFNSPTSFNRAKELLPRAHVERRRGTIDQAIEYCKKDQDVHEEGRRPLSREARGAAGRDELKLIIQHARDGNIDWIAEHHPKWFLTHYSRLKELKLRQPRILEGDLTNEWWVGPTGSGKSRLLWEQYPNHYHKQLNKWWDGYNDEETVAIEEWCPKNECTGSQLKIWADRYPFSAQIKGGTLLKIRPTRLIVLSNYEMEECFPNEADLLPLKRRFTIKRFI